MNKPRLPTGLYGMTAEEFSKGRSNEHCVRAMLAAGVPVIQYRAKGRSLKEKYHEAITLRRLCARAGSLFIVNDHIDLALMCHADGVHLGQDDWPAYACRKILSPGMLLGITAHSEEHILAAMEAGADYVGAGPLFATSTKANALPPRGLGLLDTALKRRDIDCVAIGGIKMGTLQAVLERGARTVCMVTEIVGAQDIEATAREANTRIRSSICTILL